MSRCLYCKKDISMDIEFGGNPHIHIEGIDGDGFTCSDKCHNTYRNKTTKELDSISNMTNTEFERYMLG